MLGVGVATAGTRMASALLGLASECRPVDALVAKSGARGRIWPTRKVGIWPAREERALVGRALGAERGRETGSKTERGRGGTGGRREAPAPLSAPPPSAAHPCRRVPPRTDLLHTSAAPPRRRLPPRAAPLHILAGEFLLARLCCASPPREIFPARLLLTGDLLLARLLRAGESLPARLRLAGEFLLRACCLDRSPGTCKFLHL
ncbi:hypothetical protein BS78_02G180400 [Paspalum vaginatum]|nr:hypothetical protein BS78_02G180400 [Paspalum vaginatum]